MNYELERRITEYCGGVLDNAHTVDLYKAIFQIVNEEAMKKQNRNRKKRLYYISAEFLIGKLLSNNLINLGLYADVKEILDAHEGHSLADLEEFEKEPSLGNGGLGRLASCFLDSLATLNLPGDGIGLRYHNGLFHQRFDENKQFEEKDPWIDEYCVAKRTDIVYPVAFGSETVEARLYDLPITGYEGTTNYLHLFDLDTIDESIIKNGISFDKKSITKNLTLFLYPDDSDDDGRKLRIYQQYFMVSAGAQHILNDVKSRGGDLRRLYDYAFIQINDTHPSMVIPEMIRLLMNEGIGFEEATAIITKACAYTNHTILSEALEKWPLSYLEEIVPQLVPIIKDLDKMIRNRVSDESTYIIDEKNRVHMAHMDIHFSSSTNGVAALHTKILEESELHNFYVLYPDKFNNKTNGITFRRWLMECNPRLTNEIDALIGTNWKKNANDLTRLLYFEHDENVLRSFYNIKRENKKDLAKWLLDTQNIAVNPHAMFSIQSKRLHEYKRQQLNLLYLIHTYYEIKSGYIPQIPMVCIFGAKAAPAYTIAKDIIHALLTFSKVVDEDPIVSKYLQIVFVENYNITAAEKMIPACDLSEQISLASKEASGTGNMKFMLNGALTLGTMDGANVEISERVGSDNIYIFGESSDHVIRRYRHGDYNSKEYYDTDFNIRRAVDFLVGPEMLRHGCAENLSRLHNEFLVKDYFMTFPDFNAYTVRKNQAIHDYATNPLDWARRCLVNTANAGFFSSDRTIEEYNRDIWHL